MLALFIYLFLFLLSFLLFSHCYFFHFNFHSKDPTVTNLNIEWSFDLQEFVKTTENEAGVVFELKNGRRLEASLAAPELRTALLEGLQQARSLEEESKKKFILLQETPPPPAVTN